MNLKTFFWAAGALALAAAAAPAQARPNYLTAFKEHYKVTDGKPNLAKANCSLCHIGMPKDGKWNPYGEALRKALGAKSVTDKAKLTAALTEAGKQKRGPRARLTFEEIIQRDRMPGAAPMASAAAPAAPRPAGGAHAATSGGWVNLVNGRNLDGWTKMHAGNWQVMNGMLRYTGGGNGWLKSNNTYTNYSMIVEWRFLENNPQNDAGIFLKARANDNRDPWPQSPQLNMGPGDNLGNIGGHPTTRPRADLINRGGWNTYQITVHNGDVTLAINNQRAWDSASSDALRGPGHIGIQAENRPFEIRSVWIRPLQ